jgi:hypothetical protein
MLLLPSDLGSRKRVKVRSWCLTTRCPGRAVGEGDERSVEIRDSNGVVVGDGNTQINYTYNALSVTGGVAPPPLVSVLGVVESPYRGLNPFEDGEEAFFFGRDGAVARDTAKSRSCSLK